MPKKNSEKKATTKKATKPKKLSALDAAAQVLAESGGSMTTKEMIEAMAAKKLWESPNGKTPSATLYSALLREIDTKGKDSRFKKTEPGKFAHTGASGKVEKPEPDEKPAKATKPKGGNIAKGKGKKKDCNPTEPETPAPSEPSAA